MVWAISEEMVSDELSHFVSLLLWRISKSIALRHVNISSRGEAFMALDWLTRTQERKTHSIPWGEKGHWDIDDLKWGNSKWGNVCICHSSSLDSEVVSLYYKKYN